MATSLVLYDPRTADPEVIALAGFLAGYAGRTREAYALDLRQYLAWCGSRQLRLFDAHRSDIELYARELEERGRARATISRRLSTIAGFYRYAAEEGLIEHSPAVHVRRPRLDYESRAVGLDRNELGAFLVAAGLASAQDHALASPLALNGLRISCAARSVDDQPSSRTPIRRELPGPGLTFRSENLARRARPREPVTKDLALWLATSVLAFAYPRAWAVPDQRELAEVEAILARLTLTMPRNRSRVLRTRRLTECKRPRSTALTPSFGATASRS